MNAIARTKSAFQNYLDRKASQIQTITREVNAEYKGMTAVEISTGKRGEIKSLSFESSYGTEGDWNVVIEVAGYGFMNLRPAYIYLEVE